MKRYACKKDVEGYEENDCGIFVRVDEAQTKIDELVDMLEHHYNILGDVHNTYVTGAQTLIESMKGNDMKGDAQWSSQIMEENNRLNGQLIHYKKKCSEAQAEIDELKQINTDLEKENNRLNKLIHKMAI